MNRQRICRLVSVPEGVVLIPHLEIARTWWKRFLGLQFRRSLPADSGLLLVPCSSIHTCWMRFSIDVVFLDDQGTVVDIRDGIRPWSLCWPRQRATQVLELTERCRPPELQIGQRVRYEEMT